MIKEGRTSDHISASGDLLPTFCDIAGINPPVDIDGISILPSLLSSEDQAEHDYLYWEFYEHGVQQALRMGDWKYLKLNVRDQGKEVISKLYNMKSDISEQHNIIANHPDLVQKAEEYLKNAHEPLPNYSLFKGKG